MEMPAKQTPAASSEMVKLIRKLRWVGLEEKAEQLEKKLEQLPATDTVLAIQSETDCAIKQEHAREDHGNARETNTRGIQRAPNRHRAVAIRSLTRLATR